MRTECRPARVLTLIAVVAAGSLDTGRLCAQAPRDTIDRFVQSYMREHQVPGLALGILRGGRIVKAQGYGLANVEHNAPVTTATVFESASVGKQFTAVAILLLAQDGKLALDDPISKYITTAPDKWNSITIRHLLTHTSGIKDYENADSTLNLRLDYSEVDLLKRFSGYPLLFAPGAEWSYSNSGYVLLGLIIRAVTGEHWGEFMRRRMFEPLGMTSTRVISYDDVIPNRAAGYRVLAGKLANREVIGPGWNTTADGSLLLSVLDLAKWDAALHGNSLLNDSVKQMMWTPVRLQDGTSVSHGFGWDLNTAPGRRSVEHAGGGWGFRNWIGRFLDDSITVIVLANSTGAEPTLLGHRIAALYHPRLAPAPRTAIRLTPQTLAEYVGEYRFPTGETLRLSRTDNGLRVEGDIPLGSVVPEAKDVFFNPAWGPDSESRLVFERDAQGRITWLRMKRYPAAPALARRTLR